MRQISLDPAVPAKASIDGNFKWAIVEKASQGAVIRFDRSSFAVFSMAAYPVPFRLVEIDSGTATLLCGEHNDPFPGGSGGALQGAAGGQAVEGILAAGVTPSDNPILFAGQDATPLRRVVLTDASGRIMANPASMPTGTGLVIKSLAAVALGAGAGVSLWIPAAGKKFRCLGGKLFASVATAAGVGLALCDDIGGGGGNEWARVPLGTGAGAGTDLALPPVGKLSLTVNNQLIIVNDATVRTLSGYLFGFEE